MAWRHENIAGLVGVITGDPGLAPHWSPDRFDVVLERRGGLWRLTQVPQMLLSGDTEVPLQSREPGDDR